MIISFPPINYENETLYAYAFRKEGDKFEILSNSLMSYETMPENLLNCLVAQVKEVIVASCSAIDHPLKAKQFLALLKFWQTSAFPSLPLRINIVQPANPVVAWEAIEKEHHLLMELKGVYSGELIYLNEILDPIFTLPPANEPDARLFKHLSKIQNMEGWSSYCIYLNEELERVLRTFLPTMIDEYQLEARFKDFRHEVKSVLLQDAKRELIEASLKWNAAGHDPDKFEELKTAGKKLLAAQEHLYECMKLQDKVLDEVDRGIGKIEKNHPELTGIKRKVHLLRLLLHHELIQESVPLPAALFLHQLLNLWFQVTTVVCGGDGLGRISWELAVRQALVQTAMLYPHSDLLDLFLNWQARQEELNRFAAEKGAEAFQFWLRVPAVDEEDAKRRMRLMPLFSLQTHFIDHLEHFILPLVNIEGKPEISAVDFFKNQEVAALTPFIRNQSVWKEADHLKEPAIAFYTSIFKI